MNKIAKWAGIIMLTALLLLAVTLESLQMMATSSGVRAIEIPENSQISKFTQGSDYLDAYAIQISSQMNIDNVMDQQSMLHGSVVLEAENEIILKGNAPGLHYYASYFINSSSDDSALVLSTVVVYENHIGRLYFSIIKPFHRHLVPFALSKLIGNQ